MRIKLLLHGLLFLLCIGDLLAEQPFHIQTAKGIVVFINCTLIAVKPGVTPYHIKKTSSSLGIVHHHSSEKTFDTITLNVLSHP
jgi:hypothetical protein